MIYYNNKNRNVRIGVLIIKRESSGFTVLPKGIMKVLFLSFLLFALVLKHKYIMLCGLRRPA